MAQKMTAALTRFPTFLMVFLLVLSSSGGSGGGGAPQFFVAASPTNTEENKQDRSGQVEATKSKGSGPINGGHGHQAAPSSLAAVPVADVLLSGLTKVDSLVDADGVINYWAPDAALSRNRASRKGSRNMMKKGKKGSRNAMALQVVEPSGVSKATTSVASSTAAPFAGLPVLGSDDEVDFGSLLAEVVSGSDSTTTADSGNNDFIPPASLEEEKQLDVGEAVSKSGLGTLDMGNPGSGSQAGTAATASSDQGANSLVEDSIDFNQLCKDLQSEKKFEGAATKLAKIGSDKAVAQLGMALDAAVTTKTDPEWKWLSMTDPSMRKQMANAAAKGLFEIGTMLAMVQLITAFLASPSERKDPGDGVAEARAWAMRAVKEKLIAHHGKSEGGMAMAVYLLVAALKTTEIELQKAAAEALEPEEELRKAVLQQLTAQLMQPGSTKEAQAAAVEALVLIDAEKSLGEKRDQGDTNAKEALKRIESLKTTAEFAEV